MYNDGDGFTHVSKKNNDKKSTIDFSIKSHQQNHQTLSDDESDDDQFEQLTDHQLEKIFKFYETKAAKFIQTNYFQSFKKLFNYLMNKEDEKYFDQVICYGLGNFNKDVISRKQLYFLLCLKKILKSSDWQIFDPVFSLNEQKILAKLGFILIDKNEYCRRPIKEGTQIKRTLFYMPHCHKFMLNNLLWSNWDLESFKNLYLIGNSFKLCTEELVDRNDLKEFSYLHNLKKLKMVNEFKIKNNYSNKILFNDLSFHTFETSNLKPSDLNDLFDQQFPIYQ